MCNDSIPLKYCSTSTPFFFTGTRSRSQVSGNDRLFPRGSEFGPNRDIPASPVIQLPPRPDYRWLSKPSRYTTFANRYGFSISIGNTSDYFYYVCRQRLQAKQLSLAKIWLGEEWLVLPIGFAICDDISQLPIECARNHRACALNRGMQSRTGIRRGMSGTDWQIKSWPAMVLGGEFDGRWLTTIYFHMRSEYKPITAKIMAYRNILIKNIINLGEAAIQRTASQITWHPCDSPTCPTFFSEFTKFNPLRNLSKFLTKLSFISWQLYMKSIKWELMPKVKKKSDKQRQRLDKSRKRDERATNESEVSKTKKCVEKSNIPNKTEVHISNNNRDGTSCLSNGGELSSRNCAAVDSSNVPSEAQAIVDKYLQSKRDLADRAKKKYSDSHRVQLVICIMKSLSRKWGNNTTQNGRGMPDHLQNSGNMNSKATELKCRWLGKIRRTGILNENATKNKKRKQMARKDSVQGYWERTG